MSITITQLYERLSSHIGKETAENLTSYMDNKIKEEVMESTKILATKQDIANLALTTKQDIADLASTTRQDIADLALSTKQDIAHLALTTKQDIADLASTTRQDIADLALSTKQDIAHLALTTKQDIADLASTTRQDITETKQLITDLKVEMHGFRSEMKGQMFELLKWISISWATYLGITLTIICLLLKK